MGHLIRHRVTIYVLATLMLFALTAVAVTVVLEQTASAKSGDTAYKKPNSGRGNGSEPARGVDQDPGNSPGHNKGGD